MHINTHNQIDTSVCGTARQIESGFSRVELKTNDDMKVDTYGLVHGGFVFGLADHAAMLAVNDPHVVLAGASVKFLKPVKAGEVLSAEATTKDAGKKQQQVQVTVYRDKEPVFTGEFSCFVLNRHVLE